jgi:hypothetical protein
MSKGIDISIDALIADFTDNLWDGYNTSFYGRVFRNERFEDFSVKISPEIWTSKDNYIEVLKGKSFDAQCFFDVQPDDPIEGSNVHTSIVWGCFMVDLAKVYPDLSRTEATETAHRDAERLISNSQFENEGLVRGYTGFTSYDWGRDRDNQPLVDMSPHYLFRFNLKVTYTNC